MKKVTTISLAVILIIAANIIYKASEKNPHLMAESSGAPAGHTGSPGDGANCTSCHSGLPPTPASGWITSNVPAGGYIPGTTYTITATIPTSAGSGKVRFGFQVSPQNTTGTLLGTLITTSTETQLFGSGTYVTHTSTGNSGSGTKTWSFNWVAPALGTGNVTFYGAFNVANNDFSTTGDIIYLTTLSISEGASLNTPAANDVSRCGPGTVTLTASGGVDYRWYDVPTGGTIIGTGSSYTTPSLSSTTTYYVSNYDGTLESARVSVDAIINPIPNPPTASDVERCGPGTVSLSASGSGTLSWFTTATGGSAIHTGTSFTTPSLSANETYYIEAVASGCTSATRTAVQAIINPIPSAPSVQDEERCGPGTLTLNASSSNTILWYSVSTGGIPDGMGSTFTTPSISSTTNFYVEAFDGKCQSARVTVEAKINPVPAAPSVQDAARCGSGTLTFSVQGTDTYDWYDVQSGGTSLHTGNSFTTPNLSSTTTFYVEASDGICTSQRVAFDAIIHTVMPDPLAEDVSRCGDGAVTLTASSPGATDFNWYDSPGGSVIHTGSSFTTPSLTMTTSYYVESFSSNCTSQQVEVLAIIDPLPASPQAQDEERCGPGGLTLTATGGDIYNWYDDATATTPVFTGAAFNTPSISSTTTYFVVNSDGTCESSRIPVEAVINDLPDQPEVIQVDPVTLQSSVIGDHYEWKKDNIALPDNTREITVSEEGNYTVRVEDSKGCFSEVSEDFFYTGSNIESQDQAGSFRIYPNPVTHHFMIQNPGVVHDFVIRVMDISGKTVLEEKVNDFYLHKEINIIGFTSGMYYLFLQTGEKVQIEKLMVK